MDPATPTACPDFDTLIAHANGYLDDDATAAIEQHLAGCDACLAVIAEAARALGEDLGPSHVSLGPGAAPALPVLAAPAAASTSSERRRLPAPGDKVGRYVLREVLGRGAMGVVYTAHDPELDREVAVKLVRAGRGAPDPELQARLLAEAQAMARLAHPNVVAVFDIGTVEAGVYLAMELVTGRTLEQWLETPRTWREILAVFLQAAAGLEAAHGAGIVHRDFKPDNVLIDASGRVFVTDFGLARIAMKGPADVLAADSWAASDLRRTRAGSVIGTPAYMAPEQLFALPDVDHRADVFAFGAALYKALYGRRAYPAETLPELERLLAVGKPAEPPPSKVPGFVRRAVMKALAGDAAARFQTMHALADALRKDPVKRALKVALPVAAIGLAVGTIAVVSHLTSAPLRGCRASALAGPALWSDDVKSRAEHAFIESGKAHAPDTFRTTSAALEGHLAAWAEARVAACDATHDEGVQSEALLDLRLGCLDQRLGVVKALVEALASPTPAAVDNATEAVSRLQSPAICAETERLLARVPPPADPSSAAKVKEAEATLAKAEAARLTGEWAQAKTLAESARSLAAEARYAPPEAEALTLLGEVGLVTGDLPASRAAYETAVPLAVEGGDERTAAIAAMDYGRALAQTTRLTPEALQWIRMAQAFTQRLGGDAALSTQLLLRRADVYFAAFEAPKALTDLEAALAAAPSDPPTPLTVELLLRLAGAYQQAERYAEANRAYARALGAARALLGPRHPRTLSVGGTGATCLVSSGHYAAGLAVANELLPEVERALPGDNLDRAMIRHVRGLALTGLGRYDEALSMHREAIAIEERVYGEHDGPIVVSTTFAALALVRAGRGDEALATLKRARALADRFFADNPVVSAAVSLLEVLALEVIALEPGAADAAARLERLRAALPALEKQIVEHMNGKTEHAWVLDALGRLALREGRAADAVTRHEQALAIISTHYEATSLELAPTLADLGAAYGAAGRKEAAPTLERALAMFAGEPHDPLLEAEVRWRLSQVVRATDPTRASELAREALELARELDNPRAGRLLAEMRAATP